MLHISVIDDDVYFKSGLKMAISQFINTQEMYRTVFSKSAHFGSLELVFVNANLINRLGGGRGDYIKSRKRRSCKPIFFYIESNGEKQRHSNGNILYKNDSVDSMIFIIINHVVNCMAANPMKLPSEYFFNRISECLIKLS
jgi:hypothetical protein